MYKIRTEVMAKVTAEVMADVMAGLYGRLRVWTQQGHTNRETDSRRDV